MSLFNISFDPRSISVIAQMHGFQVLLSPEVQTAMKQGGETLVEAMRGAMHWKNGIGTLSDSLIPIVDSPYEIQVGSPLPYAARRNWGFSGKTDSRGVLFVNDPGAYYAENGMAAASSQILIGMDNGVSAALARMAGG